MFLTCSSFWVQEATNQQLEMHIRIKRAETVLFLYVDPSDTIRDVKEKIETLLGQVLPLILPK